MSLILDALKKSELERRGQAALPRRHPPSMDELLEGPKPEPKQTTKWPLTIGVFLVACAASAGATYHFLQPQSPPVAAVEPNTPIAGDPEENGATVEAEGPVADIAPTQTNTEDESIEITQTQASIDEAPTEPEPTAIVEETVPAPVIDQTSVDPVEPEIALPVGEFIESDPPPATSDVVVLYAAEPEATPGSIASTETELEPAAEAESESAETSVAEVPTDSVVAAPEPLPEAIVEPAAIDDIASIDPGVFAESEPEAASISPPALPPIERKPSAPSRPTAEFEAAATIQPSSSDPIELYQRASALEQEGLFDRAIETYTAAILARPNFVEAYYGRAWSHIGNGSYDAAIRNFDTLIGLNNGMAEAFHGRVWALELAGRYTDAISDYSEAIRRAPGNPSLRFNRGILKLYGGDFSGADADFMTVREQSSGANQDYALLWTFIARARDGTSPENILPALRSLPAETRWSGRILDFYFSRSDRNAVLAEARDASYPESSRRLTIAHYFLGQFALMQGDEDGAKEDFRRAVRENATGVRQYWAANLELERLGDAN